MEPFLKRHYKLDTKENYYEYLTFIETYHTYRSNIMHAKPVASLERNIDGSYTIEMYLQVRGTRSTFRLGEEYIERRGDDVKVRSVAEIEGNRLYITQVEQNGRKSWQVYEFTPDVLTMTTTAEGWDGKAVMKFNFVDLTGRTTV